MVSIDFKYKIKEYEYWKDLELTANEYFELDTDEEPEIWSLPKWNKLLDYIDIEKAKVDDIIIKITDSIKEESLIFKQKFWNNQRNSLLESIEDKQGITDIELILETLVNDNPDEEVWEIIRFSRSDGLLTPTLHTFITENKDGLVSEKIVVPKPNQQ